jgi:hypothetical protein
MRALLIAVGLCLVARVATAQTVDQVVATHSGGCTTAGVEGLSAQLVRVQICMNPTEVTQFTPYPNITLASSDVHPLAVTMTRDALHAAADMGALDITSAFRTLADQYLLYNEGGCSLVAVPGNSNHETGRAVDLSNWSAALGWMTAAGCTHTYPSTDPVHFDCPGPDMRAASVLTFQHLWNVNNPSDTIAEDGAYGPATGSRLGRSPAAGFAMDGCTTMPPATWGAAFVMQTFPLSMDPPLVMTPGQMITGTIELRNTGNQTWDTSTHLATTGPRDRTSAFAGPDWVAPNRPAGVTGTVAPGASYSFTFTLLAPATLGTTTEHFGVVQDGVAWFSDPGELGPADDLLAVRITVVAAGSDAGTSSDAGNVDGATRDASATVGDASVVDAGTGAMRGMAAGCGCRAGSHGTSGTSIFVISIAIALRRRRRRV